MEVLIAGAGGFLGEHVVREAVRAGHAVTAAVRPGTQRPFPQGVTRLEVDLTDAAVLRGVLQNFDGVIFSAGRNWQPGLRPGEYLRQNLEPVQVLFQAVESVARPLRVVFTSSMSAIAGSSEPVVFDESADGRGVCTPKLSPYDHAKIACEQRAREAIAAGRDVVILNPGYMLGPGASAESSITTTFLVKWFCLRKNPGIVGCGGQTYCDVRDVARAHVAALERGAPGERYILGGENLTNAELHRRMAAQTGIPRPSRMHPGFVVALMSALDLVSGLSRGRWSNPVHRDFARSLPLYYWGNSDRAVRDLDYRSRPLAETIRDTIVDFVNRQILGEQFRWICSMTDENRRPLLLLRQLASRSLYRRFLLPRLPAALAAARQNAELNAALEQLLASREFNPDKGRFPLNRSTDRLAVEKLRDLLDYVYFSSNEFYGKVS